MSKKKVEKVKKKIKKTIIIAVIILLVLSAVIYLLGLKVSFVIKEEMSVSLSPLEKSFTVKNNENPTINFNVEINNPRVCKFECNYQLLDISSEEMLINQSVKNEDKLNLSFELPINSKGSGQKMFNYKISCNNVKSTLCSTGGKQYFKTSLITVNYELTEEEETLKSKFEIDLESNIQQLQKIDELLMDNLNLINQLEFIEGKISDEEKEFLNNYQNQKDSFNELKENSNEWIKLWDKQNYYVLDEQFSATKKEKIISLFKDVKQSQTTIFMLAKEFNNSIKILTQIKNNEGLLEDIYNYKIENNNSITSLFQLKEDVEIETNTLMNKQFSSFESFNNEVLKTNKLFENITNEYLATRTNLIIRTEQKTNLITNIMNYTRNEIISKTDNTCNDINLTENTIQAFNQKSELNKNTLFPFLNNSILLDKAIIEYRNFLIKKLNGSNETFELSQAIYGNAPTDYPVEINGIIQTTYDLTSIRQQTFNKLVILKENFTEEKTICFNQNTSFEINITIELLDSKFLKLKTYSISDQLFKLPESQSQCCIFGKCQPCCKENECLEQYPVIFVHGHAISKDNSPENSHEAFANIQALMEKEGYINAGQIGEGSISIPNGEWGRMNAPISIRVSYYQLTYVEIGKYQVVSQKTEKIENYAIRLRELIKEVKDRTGKDKVIIVAHSMGGLVTREYVALFGENDVDKIILIGTPNLGIEGRIKRLCSVTGSSRECRDMNYDSIFMKKLNSQSNAFQDINGYTITATGCDMKIGDGDGIVLAKNVPLNFTTNYQVKGECTDVWNSNLHTKILDPKLYPETFELIKAILKE